jgi:carbon storage regulator
VGMLILTRKPEQSLVIQGDITIRILSVDGDRVKIGIIAPSGVKVMRAELLEAVRAENQAAVAVGDFGPAASAIRQALLARGDAADPGAPAATAEVGVAVDG